MIIYRRTSILESSAQTLVNTVNCVGVMGKGIAKGFKEREPEMFAAYRKICDQNLLAPGKLWLWQGANCWILSFPTKKHWRNPSKLEWIEQGLVKFVAEYEEKGIKEISFPRLGCGNGGLDWETVKPLMVKYLRPLSIPVYIHDFEVEIGLPEHLEEVAERLKAEAASIGDFDSFLMAIRRVTELTSGNLIDLQSHQPFSVIVDADDHLNINSAGEILSLERDDLRGVWLSLMTGLVTNAKAGWFASNGGGALLSIIGLLPEVRAIQIETQVGNPEVALELRQSPFTLKSVMAPA